MRAFLLSLAVGVAVQVLCASPGEADPLVSYQSDGWRYLQVASGDPTGGVFMIPEFDDATWPVGRAAFGASGFPCPLNATISTFWSANSDLLLRRHFDASASSPVTIYIAIDNDAVVYVNGTEVLSVVHEGCATLDNFEGVVPAGILRNGSNLLAVKAVDRGSTSYVDVRIDGTPPRAKAEMVQTDCDTISTTPVRVRATAALVNLGEVGLCGLRLVPAENGPFAPCPVLDCAAPSGWSCAVDPATGSATWLAAGSACAAPRTLQRGFSLTVASHACCYTAEFLNAFGEIVATSNTCFICDITVGTESVTWTQMRSLYR